MSFITDLFGSTTPQTPTPRSPSQEFAQSLNAMIQAEPAMYAADATYQPKYGQLNLDLLNQQMNGYYVPQPTTPPPGSTTTGTPVSNAPAPGSLSDWLNQLNDAKAGKGPNRGGARVAFQYPGAPTITATPGYHPGTLALAGEQRASEIGDVLKYGPAATAAVLAANPWLAGALTTLSGTLDKDPLLTRLNSNAASALDAGGYLSPQDERDSQQAARASFTARGLGTSDMGAASEILNRDAAVRARLQAAQQFASGVEGLNQNQDTNIARATGVIASATPDPFQTVLGRPSTTNVSLASSMFNPQSSYFSDLYNTNYNAQAASDIATANNNAAIQAALIGSIGKAAGAAAASDRRLKENIRRIGKSRQGHGVYRWNYKGSKKTFIGPVAQDVEKRRPDAISIEPLSGRKIVNLRKVDTGFMEVGNLLAA